MATLREYYDADFNYAARMQVKLKAPDNSEIEAAVLYDFAGYTAFFICYVDGEGRDYRFFGDLVASLDYGKTQFAFDNVIKLPSARQFPGALRVENKEDIDIQARFHGEPDWISSKQIQCSRRIFIYSETQLTDAEILKLKDAGRELHGHEVQFRSVIHSKERSKLETPMAFISHDSRDKKDVARPVALQLQKFMCPVWYDEFSLNVGDNLRDKIEAGLKECKKCIVILSPNFFSNKGWTKKEFDSIFIREINEKEGIVLPIWFGVSSKEVYDYCPSLQNVVGLNWNELGQEELCRRLANVLLKE